MRPSVKLGKDRKKLTLGPNLGPLNKLLFFLWFSLTQILKTKPTLSNFTNILLATTKTLLLTCFRFEKKNHRPNISQLHPTASEKKTPQFCCQQCQKISRKL